MIFANLLSLVLQQIFVQIFFVDMGLLVLQLQILLNLDVDEKIYIKNLVSKPSNVLLQTYLFLKLKFCYHILHETIISNVLDYTIHSIDISKAMVKNVAHKNY